MNQINNKIITVLWFTVFLLVVGNSPVRGEDNGTFSGRVVDVTESPVAGALVYIYGNNNVRRPADYIAPPTNNNGEFLITLPVGTYWTVVRIRHGEKRFGPLQPGDKHSGAPLETDIYAGENTEEEYVVADLEETSRLTVKFDTSFIPVRGVLLTKKGKPVDSGYVFANRSEAVKRIPDYISAWTDSSGRYTLFLPPGTYYFSVAREFPPGSGPVKFTKVTIDKNTKDINIVIAE